MKNFFWGVYQWVIAIPILFCLTIVTALLTILFSVLGMSKWGGYYPAHYWAKMWCILMFVRVEVSGRENIDRHTSYVFVANHQGAYDIFLIYGYLNHNFKWMMKKSLSKIPFVGAACKISKHIMVDRSSASAVQQTMKHAESVLKDGMSLVVFPEGTRTGSFGILRKDSLRIHPGKITLTIHAPLEFEKESDDKERIDRMLEKSFETIKQSLQEEA